MTTTFQDLGLSEKLIEGLKKAGITVPTAIQAQAIPPLIKNKDLIGQTQTGSGKTLAYLLPLFTKVDVEKREMQAIVLAPTHELVMQIDQQIKILATNSGIPVTSTPIIGDVNIVRQIEALRDKPHIIVGSVGRVQELINKKKIKAHTIKTIVIDEGDRLLDQNDVNRVKEIIKSTLKERQLVIFAAHINQKALSIAKEITPAAEVIKIQEQHIVNPDITHLYFMAESQRDKLEVLRKLINALAVKKAIVFVNDGEDIQRITERLQERHYQVHKIFGRVSKEERQRALENFRRGGTQILVASDIAARGLDVQGVSHVFNLDLPENAKEYLNRSGRTGRSGQQGTSVAIVTQREIPILKEYEKVLKIKISRKEVYQGTVIAQKPRSKVKRSDHNKRP